MAYVTFTSLIGDCLLILSACSCLCSLQKSALRRRSRLQVALLTRRELRSCGHLGPRCVGVLHVLRWCRQSTSDEPDSVENYRVPSRAAEAEKELCAGENSDKKYQSNLQPRERNFNVGLQREVRRVRRLPRVHVVRSRRHKQLVQDDLRKLLPVQPTRH